MRLLVLGTGGMANNHAMHFAAIEGVELVGGGRCRSRPGRSLRRRATRSPKRFTSLDEAIAWGEFDAATNVTPDSIHHPTTLALLAAGKHVFCEKPLAENYRQGRRDDRGGGSRRPDQHGQPDLPQRRRRCRRRARWCLPARSARSAMSRRPTCRAGWSPRPGATGRPKSQVALAAVDQARLQRRARRCRHPYSRFRHLWRGSDIDHRVRAAEDLRQGAGQPDRRIRSRRQ